MFFLFDVWGVGLLNSRVDARGYEMLALYLEREGGVSVHPVSLHNLTILLLV